MGQYGELTIEQARSLAQEWLAQVRRGGDPAADKAAARKAPTVKELCGKFTEDYSKVRNKPSTQESYQGTIDRNIIPILGRMKVQDVKRPDVAAMMKKMVHKEGWRTTSSLWQFACNSSSLGVVARSSRFNGPGWTSRTGASSGPTARPALKAAGAAHVGTHGIRHRSATDIANSGIPVKVGMALTAHKTAAMFMRYVHRR